MTPSGESDIDRTHVLSCDGRPLPRGTREQRPWSCSCGRWRVPAAYDAAARRSHHDHVEREPGPMTQRNECDRPIWLTVAEARVIHWALTQDLDTLRFDQSEVKNMVRNIRDNLEGQLAAQ